MQDQKQLSDTKQLVNVIGAMKKLWTQVNEKNNEI